MALYSKVLWIAAKWYQGGWIWHYLHGEVLWYYNGSYPKISEQLGISILPTMCQAIKITRLGLHKYDMHPCAVIYPGRFPLHVGSVYLVINPETGHVLPQYHVVCYDNLSTVPFIR